MYCKSCPAPCPQEVQQCIARIRLPTAPRRCGGALHRFRPLWQRPPLGQDSPSPQLLGPRVAGVPLPATLRRRGSALQEFRCPLTPGGVAVYSRSCTAQCPPAVSQCIAREVALPTAVGVALPTAPRQCKSALHGSTGGCPWAVCEGTAAVALPIAPGQWGSAMQELHCRLPPNSAVM